MTGKGRPTKLTPELSKTICDYIAAGNYFETACQAVGITPAIFCRWRAIGEKSANGPLRTFFEATKKAEGQAIARNVLIIAKAAEKTWPAAAWLLERKYPALFGRRDSVEHSGPGGGPIPIMPLTALARVARDGIEANGEQKALAPVGKGDGGTPLSYGSDRGK